MAKTVEKPTASTQREAQAVALAIARDRSSSAAEPVLAGSAVDLV